MDRQRNPEQIGYEWCAWYALEGDEPLECVAEAARHLEQKLGELAAGALGPAEGRKVAGSAHLFMIAIAELLNENGSSQFKAEIKRRRKGKPINQHDRALVGNRAANIVERLVSEEWKQEAAIEQATSETGLSRAEIMTWLAKRRWDRAATTQDIRERYSPGAK